MYKDGEVMRYFLNNTCFSFFQRKYDFEQKEPMCSGRYARLLLPTLLGIDEFDNVSCSDTVVGRN